MTKDQIFTELGLNETEQGTLLGNCKGPVLDVHSPIDGSLIGRIVQADADDYEKVMSDAEEAFVQWRKVPAPARGEVVRLLGEELRKHKEALGALVTLEMGKIHAEGMGEVQEMIDICDFAVGLSRQLYGLSMHSERPDHRMFEQWHPLGVVGIISAFNFPVAVWAWNFAIAAVCGDACLWKPSSKTPLTAVACSKIAKKVFNETGYPEAIASVVIGKGSVIGEKLVSDPRIPLVSATGSTPMGQRIGAIIGARLGRTILELGGNNAIIVSDQADLDMVLPATLFGAVGTAGQRCTSTRRMIVNDKIYDQFRDRLVAAYGQVKIGDPLKPGTLMGPLIDTGAVQDMMNAIERVKAEGGRIICGGEKLDTDQYPGGCYVTPCIAEVENSFKIVQEETFAPLLYLIRYSDLDEAIRLHNNVPQGLSSSIFTLNMREMERFLSYAGSDCGIANCNIGTSGAEIGGAFGGEKDTGGGREAGSDSWKAYMRRQTCTLNWSTELPLAQGIKFGG